MSIVAQAAADAALILSGQEEITLTPPEDDAQTVNALVSRTSERIDPTTGESILEARTVVTAAMSAVTGAVAEGWGVSLTDEAGNTVTGTVVNPRPDYTFAIVKFNVEITL